MESKKMNGIPIEWAQPLTLPIKYTLAQTLGYTLPETNIAPENRPSSVFQPSILGAMLVSGRVIVESLYTVLIYISFTARRKTKI